MADFQLTTINCPVCGSEFQAKSYTNLNSHNNANEFDELCNGHLFAQHCPSCHEHVVVDFPVLVDDMDNKYLIQYIPASKDGKDAVMHSLANFTGLAKHGQDTHYAGYGFRICMAQTDLQEKILIAKAGLDDRVVELVKGLLAIHQASKSGFAVTSPIYFEERQNDNLIFEIHNENHEHFDIICPEDTYKSLGDDFKFEDKNSEGFVINRAWALEALMQKEEEEASKQSE